MMMNMEKTKKTRVDDRSKKAKAVIAADLFKPAIVTAALEPEAEVEDVVPTADPLLKVVLADPYGSNRYEQGMNNQSLPFGSKRYDSVSSKLALRLSTGTTPMSECHQ